MSADVRERIANIEARLDALEKRLDRIEEKLDELISASAKANGARMFKLMLTLYIVTLSFLAAVLGIKWVMP